MTVDRRLTRGGNGKEKSRRNKPPALKNTYFFFCVAFSSNQRRPMIIRVTMKIPSQPKPILGRTSRNSANLAAMVNTSSDYLYIANRDRISPPAITEAI